MLSARQLLKQMKEGAKYWSHISSSDKDKTTLAVSECGEYRLEGTSDGKIKLYYRKDVMKDASDIVVRASTYILKKLYTHTQESVKLEKNLPQHKRNLEELIKETRSGYLKWQIHLDNVAYYVNYPNENFLIEIYYLSNHTGVWELNCENKKYNMDVSELVLAVEEQLGINHSKNNEMQKLRWTLLDFKTIEGMVRALEHGTTKYEENSWKILYTEKEAADKVLRHLIAYLKGEYIDKESGLPHIDHLQADAMILAYIAKQKHEEKKNEKEM